MSYTIKRHILFPLILLCFFPFALAQENPVGPLLSGFQTLEGVPVPPGTFSLNQAAGNSCQNSCMDVSTPVVRMAGNRVCNTGRTSVLDAYIMKIAIDDPNGNCLNCGQGAQIYRVAETCKVCPANPSCNWVCNEGACTPPKGGDCCDPDGDGVEYRQKKADNYPSISNPDQSDIDHDGLGDVCDNCPSKSNPDQGDRDKDDVGDVCDNCKDKDNKNQKNADGDPFGDACDNCKDERNDDQGDDDSDGIGNTCDNCRQTDNPDQAETDGDDVGDACDLCQGKRIYYNHPPTFYRNVNAVSDSDGDTVANACDNCMYKSNPDQKDDNGRDDDDCIDPEKIINTISGLPMGYQIDPQCGDACEYTVGGAMARGTVPGMSVARRPYDPEDPFLPGEDITDSDSSTSDDSSILPPSIGTTSGANSPGARISTGRAYAGTAFSTLNFVGILAVLTVLALAIFDMRKE